MDITTALEELIYHNLNPKRAFWNEDVIVGFLKKDTDSSKSIIGDGYAIEYLDGDWIATVADPETILFRSTSLTDAVNAICQFYELRETTFSDSVTPEDAVELLRQANLPARLTGSKHDTIWVEL